MPKSLTPVLVFWTSVSLAVVAAKNLHSFSALDIDGKEMDLSIYRGKVVLVVNVARQCGYTDANYQWMSETQDRFGREQFALLAFPCNQFGSQEPGQNAEIKAFAVERKATFDLFSKVKVLGSNAHSVFKYLAHKTGHKPQWNFAKYLINGHGDVVQFFETTTELAEVTDAIEKQIRLLPTHKDDL